MRVYVDTNVIIDMLSNRDCRGEIFFTQTFSCKHTIIISDLTLQELKHNHYNPSTLLQWLTALKKLTFAVSTPEQKLEAKQYAKLNNTHKADALHAILALSNGAECLLTQNIKDFANCYIAKKYDDIDIK